MRKVSPEFILLVSVLTAIVGLTYTEYVRVCMAAQCILSYALAYRMHLTIADLNVRNTNLRTALFSFACKSSIGGAHAHDKVSTVERNGGHIEDC